MNEIQHDPDPDRQHDDPDWHNDRSRESIPYDDIHPDGEGTDDDWEDE